MKDKMIVVGISGGIAAYKACEIVSSLKKLGADVHVIMTKNATEFVCPLTFESLSNNPVTFSMFGDKKEPSIKHISLAKACDIALIAPCSANVIGKIAAGIADDFLSTFVMACTAPIILAPAMNTNMYNSEAYKANSALLKRRGFLFVEPMSGRLACGDEGKGRLADPQTIIEFVKAQLHKRQDYSNKHVVVTAGGTILPIDPVRCITNHSSGKMGIEIARAATERGATVTLIKGKTAVLPDFPCKIIDVSTTRDMLKVVMDSLKSADYIIKAAAPSDYEIASLDSSLAPEGDITSGSLNKTNSESVNNIKSESSNNISSESVNNINSESVNKTSNKSSNNINSESRNKIKSETLTLTLKKGVDIAMEVGKAKGKAKLVIFAAETENIIENAQAKLVRKNADMVVANNVIQEGAGFDSDTNIASIIFKDGRIINLEKMTKRELGHIILDNLL